MKNEQDFIPALSKGEMDVSSLKDCMYIVERDVVPRPKLTVISLFSNLMNFEEMLEHIGKICENKATMKTPLVIMFKKDLSTSVALKTSTVEYLQLNYKDVILQSILGEHMEFDNRCTIWPQYNIVNDEGLIDSVTMRDKDE